MISFERLWAILIKPWVMVCVLAVIILSILYLDQPIAYYFYDLDLRTNLPILNWLTKLGLGGVYLFPLFVLALFFRYIDRQKKWELRAWFLWWCALIPSVICMILKMAFGRARPSLLFDDHIYGFYGLKTHAPFLSFPSGHTSTVMGVTFGLCVLFPRCLYVFILSGLVVASTRIFLTYHYISDVLAAGYLALVEVGLLVWWLRYRKARLFTHNFSCS